MKGRLSGGEDAEVVRRRRKTGPRAGLPAEDHSRPRVTYIATELRTSRSLASLRSRTICSGGRVGRLLFGQMSIDDVQRLVHLDDHGVRRAPWDELARGELTATEQCIVDHVTAGLQRVRPSVVNEATVWSRAIFPLLSLAEEEGVELQAEVPLLARIGDTEIAGCLDGALGKPFGGTLRAPFLVVVEAKRSVEGHDPIAQLYGEVLAAASLNALETGQSKQRIHGCYTIAATWAFVRADIEGLDTERPRFSVVSSPEISEKLEAATIVKIFKSIVALHLRGEG